MYDIVYSVLFYERIEFINHFINNVKKMNKNNNYLIIAHLSESAYLEKELIIKENVIINNKYYNKIPRNYSILQAILDNYEYLIKNGINFNHFMPLSSGCRFVKPAPHFKYFYKEFVYKLENDTKHLYNIINDINWSHYKLIFKDIKLIEFFKNKSIEIIHSPTSGRLYTNYEFFTIYSYINKYNLIGYCTESNYYDEILLPTLSNYLTGNLTELICYTFWEKGHPYTFRLSNMLKIMKENEHICIFKGFACQELKGKQFEYINKLK